MEISSSGLEVIRFCFSKFFHVIKEDKNLFYSFTLAVGVFLIALLFNVTLPLMLKYTVQALEGKLNNPQLILMVVLGYGFMWTVAQIGEHIREMASVRAVERALRKFINSFYETILTQPNPQKRLPPTGSIINKLSIFREGFHNLIWGILFFLVPTIMEILCACLILWYFYGGFYSVILLITVILYSFCTYCGVSLYLKYQIQTYDQSALVSGFLSDRLFNIETVSSLGNPQSEGSLLNNKLKDLEDKTTKTKQIFETVRVVQGVIIGSALTLIVYHSVNSIIKGNQNISDFVLINSYMLQFFTPLSSLGIILNDIYRSFAEVSGMIELMKANSEDKRVSGNLIPPSTPTNLTVKDVAFSYITRDRSFLLKDINISIKAGWKVGIVGHSGSGKTTLGKILSGLYVPEKGEILLNDIRYSSYEHQALKSVISYTPQQVQIFNDTLRANIMYSNPDASSQELEIAIKESQLNEVINGLPYGVDTILGEQGQSLSGGERQRIGIARAILKRSSIYILDEPTSFLDLKTEELILNYFRSQEKIMTQIIIAHRLHMVMDSDWIIMLEKGEVIAQGSPQHLKRTCSSFRELWELDKHESSSQTLTISRKMKVKRAS